MALTTAKQRWPVTERLLTVDDVARRLSISHGTAYKLVRTGEIRSARVGHQFRVHPKHLAEYLERSVIHHV